jgi:hypothetical protein
MVIICPDPLVQPDAASLASSHSVIEWVGDTGCAVPCRDSILYVRVRILPLSPSSTHACTLSCSVCSMNMTEWAICRALRMLLSLLGAAGSTATFFAYSAKPFRMIRGASAVAALLDMLQCFLASMNSRLRPTMCEGNCARVTHDTSCMLMGSLTVSLEELLHAALYRWLCRLRWS